MGMDVVLAPNPLFSAVATLGRMGWDGLDKADFLRVTTYENSHYCKPNPAYYQEILDVLGPKAEKCAMVGNATADDLSAEQVGCACFC